MALEQVTAVSEARDINRDLQKNDFSALHAELNDINKFGQSSNYGPQAVYDQLSPSAKNEIALRTDKDGHQFLEFSPLPISAPTESARHHANSNEQHANESNQNPVGENTTTDNTNPENAKPAQVSTKASDGSAKPSDGSAKPSDGSAKPSDSSTKPGDGGETQPDSIIECDPTSSNFVQSTDSYIRQ